MSPYEEPVRGLPAIAELWEAERDGPDEPFAMLHEIVAVDGDTAVVRVEVRYDRAARRVPRRVAHPLRPRRSLRGVRGVAVRAGAARRGRD